MNWHKNKGFSLIEVLAGAALVSVWSVTSLQLLQTSLSAIERASQKAQAAELMMTYTSDAQRAWSQENGLPSVVEVDSFLIESELIPMDQFTATAEVTVSWGNESKLRQQLWLSR
ncbi:type IV pilus modification PilV family protein [Idiomarina ramblicola]|uniref:Type II secretion pathway-like protein n=1 Tax=Idiomarina ramblicola TaxID=263724 RepID=A0A432YV34_9GAMM|nr:type II secretion system protein [Idiomarina ramblicola]RUO67172.1 Type II secretion pathway-like protein [Idiomarina ramblicola]